MLSIYCNDDPENKYPGFKTLKDDLIRLKELQLHQLLFTQMVIIWQVLVMMVLLRYMI